MKRSVTLGAICLFGFIVSWSGCATEDGMLTRGPPLKPATGVLGAIHGEPVRIEVIRVVEAALIDVDAQEKSRAITWALPEDWRRPRALGLWIQASQLADRLERDGIVIDDSDIERAAVPFALSAARHLGEADSAERAQIDRVTRRLALAVIARQRELLVEEKAKALPSSINDVLKQVSPAHSQPAVQALVAYVDADNSSVQEQARKLDSQVRALEARWHSSTPIVDKVVPRRAVFLAGDSPRVLTDALFATEPGTVVGPVLIENRWAVARLTRRYQKRIKTDVEKQVRRRWGERAHHRARAALGDRSTIQLHDLGLRRWLEAYDVNPDGTSLWEDPCSTSPISAYRCKAWVRFSERVTDSARLVALPRSYLLNACNDGDQDACIALGDDRGLMGPRLSTLWRERQTCTGMDWACERTRWLTALGDSPLASANRTLLRLARRCATWDPADCLSFVALFDEVVSLARAQGSSLSLPEAPWAWALSQSCERTGHPVPCLIALEDNATLETQLIGCFEKSGAPAGQSLRAAACRELMKQPLEGRARARVISRACQWGDAEACHQTVQWALARGKVAGALKAARQAFKTQGGEEGVGAAASFALIAAETGCRAQQPDACMNLARMLIDAESSTAAAFAKARDLLADVCRTSAVGCTHAHALALEDDPPDFESALGFASAACRQGQTALCREEVSLKKHLVDCPLEDEGPGDCRPLVPFFTKEGKTSTHHQVHRLLLRSCQAGDAEACKQGLKVNKAHRLRLRDAFMICQQPASILVDDCYEIRQWMLDEKKCRDGDALRCVTHHHRTSRWSTTDEEASKASLSALNLLCMAREETACQSLLEAEPPGHWYGLLGTCAWSRSRKRGPSCVAWIQHLRGPTSTLQPIPQQPPRAVQALGTARLACRRGTAQACRLLGEMWSTGESGSWSIDKAYDAWERGCRLGDADSCLLTKVWSTPSE